MLFKVVLSFDLMRSIAFSEEEKTLLRTQLSSKLTNEEQLLLTCDEDRSQIKNKEIIIKRFLALITKALVVPKTRKPTKTQINHALMYISNPCHYFKTRFQKEKRTTERNEK